MNVLRGATNYVTGALGLGSSSENSGALDVMVVEHEDGVMACTPFHVRFSKVNPTNSKERVVRLRVNGRVVPLCMKLGAAGEAFFVERVHNPLRRDLVTSPLSSPMHGDGTGDDQRGGYEQPGKQQGHPWDESPAQQEDWSSHQLRNYQLLSDLSSDDETAGDRETPVARESGELLQTDGRSFSPSRDSSQRPAGTAGNDFPDNASAKVGEKAPPSQRQLSSPQRNLAQQAFESDESETERCAAKVREAEKLSLGDAGRHAGPEGEKVAANGGQSTAVDIDGPAASPAVGSLPPVSGLDAASGREVPADDVPFGESGQSQVKVREQASDGSGAGVVDGGSKRWAEGESDGDEEDNAGGDEDDSADGDEEDNADGREGEKTDGGGTDRGEGTEGEEGRWWWSWTWGALPVRKKPKSTRRKYGRRAKSSRKAGRGGLEEDTTLVSPSAEAKPIGEVHEPGGNLGGSSSSSPSRIPDGQDSGGQGGVPVDSPEGVSTPQSDPIDSKASVPRDVAYPASEAPDSERGRRHGDGGEEASALEVPGAATSTTMEPAGGGNASRVTSPEEAKGTVEGRRGDSRSGENDASSLAASGNLGETAEVGGELGDEAPPKAPPLASGTKPSSFPTPVTTELGGDAGHTAPKQEALGIPLPITFLIREATGNEERKREASPADEDTGKASDPVDLASSTSRMVLEEGDGAPAPGIARDVDGRGCAGDEGAPSARSDQSAAEQMSKEGSSRIDERRGEEAGGTEHPGESEGVAGRSSATASVVGSKEAGSSASRDPGTERLAGVNDDDDRVVTVTATPRDDARDIDDPILTAVGEASEQASTGTGRGGIQEGGQQESTASHAPSRYQDACAAAEAAAAVVASTVSPPPQHPDRTFPGDESPVRMVKTVVAVESVGPDVETWISQDPTAVESSRSVDGGSLTDDVDVGDVANRNVNAGGEVQVAAVPDAGVPVVSSFPISTVGQIAEEKPQARRERTSHSVEGVGDLTGGVETVQMVVTTAPPGSGAAKSVVGSSSVAPVDKSTSVQAPSSIPALRTDLPLGPPIGPSPASPSGSSAGSGGDIGVLGDRTSRQGSVMDLRGFHTPQGGSGTDLFGLAEAAGSSTDAAYLCLLGGFGPDNSSSSPTSSAAVKVAAVAVGATIHDVGPTIATVLEGGDGRGTLDKAFQGGHPMQPVAPGAVEDLGDNGWSIGRPATPNLAPPVADADQVGGEVSKTPPPPWGPDGAADEPMQERDQTSADGASKTEWKRGQDTPRGVGRGIRGELSAAPQAFGTALDGTNIETVVPLTSTKDLEVEEKEGSAALGVARKSDGRELSVEDLGMLGNARAGDNVNTAVTGADGAGGGLEGAVSVTSTQRRGPSSDLTSHRPVFSLSGHLIGPELRGGKSSEEAHRIARHAFESKVVGWEEFSRSTKEVLADPNLLVAAEGRLLTFSEALPHLVAMCVFDRSLLGPSAPRSGESSLPDGSDGPDGFGDGRDRSAPGRVGEDNELDDGARSSYADTLPSAANGVQTSAGMDGGASRITESGLARGNGSGVSSGDTGRGSALDGGDGRGGESSGGVKAPRGDVGGETRGEVIDPAGAGEAPGTWWGVGGWFARRSSASPPMVARSQSSDLPPSGSTPVGTAESAVERSASGGVNNVAGSDAAVAGGRGGSEEGSGGRQRDVDPSVGDEGPSARMRDSRRGQNLVDEGGDVTVPIVKGSGGDSADVVRRPDGLDLPAPLSMELVGKGGAAVLDGVSGAGIKPVDDGDGRHHHDSEEDEDIYGKTLRPSSEQLAALKLKVGCNTVEFVSKLAGQAERVVSSRVFLWSSNAKVVVSDIDGTIARSGGGPGMGSFTPVLGPGVHKDLPTLFSKIAQNGYKILYLTSRPLPDWYAKKGMDGGVGMPRGPVLCSPEAFFRNPQARDRRSSHQKVFKMTALRGLKLVFPADVNPLYAGFINSFDDMVAFKKMAVPEGRIFIINTAGDLHKINHTYRQTCLSLSEQVNLTFPALPDDGAGEHDHCGQANPNTADGSDGYDGHPAQHRGEDGDGALAAASVSAGDMSSTAANSGVSGSGDGGGGGAIVGTGPSMIVSSAGSGIGFLPQGAGQPDTRSAERGRESPVVAGPGSGSGSRPRSESVSGSGSGISLGRGGTCTERGARREKSFYPNRAAVEDQFTDLNYWRDPPALIGDDDLYDEEDGDDHGE